MAVTDRTPAAATTPLPTWDRRLERFSWLGVPLVIYAVSRLGQILVLSWMSSTPVVDQLVRWDGGWYLSVAEQFYPDGVYRHNGHQGFEGFAFFPTYPLLVRGVHEVTRLDYASAALVASWLAAAVAAAVVYALGTRLYDARVGAALCALFCAQPMSLVLSMAYSEGLFVALAAGALLAAYRRAWLTASSLAFLCGLTRPTGVAVGVAVALAAGLELRRGGRPRWRPVLAAGFALSGVPAYLIFVALRRGSWHAWFDIQSAGWGSTFDFGAAIGRFVLNSLQSGDGWVELSVSLLLVAAVVCGVLTVTMRLWPPLVAYGLLALVLVLGQSGFYHSKPRLLVPVFVLLVPAAVALGRARRSTAMLVLLGYGAFGLWYGSDLLTVWHFAI